MNDPIYCPDCETDMGIVRRLFVGEEVICPDCGQEFEVVNADPVEMVPIDTGDGEEDDDPDDLDDADYTNDWEDDLED